MTKKKPNLNFSKKKPNVDKNIDNSKKRFLIVASAFVTGASVMIIEIAANRVLAPWFGNSLYTWTSLIGVILLSLSIGYYFGGWLADKSGKFITFFHIITVSSFFVFFIPFLKIILHEQMFNMGMISGPVIASILLFTIPGILLGSVSSYAIRLVSFLSSDIKIGISAGLIAMFSTLGSVTGTFLTGFLLIPKFNLHNIFLINSIILLILSVSGYYFFGDIKYKINIFFCIFSVVIIIIFSVFFNNIFYHRNDNLIYEKSTFYHRIRVFHNKLQNGKILRSLFLDTTSEGGQYLNSDEIPVKYQKYWELCKIFNKNLNDVVFLGAGSFTMPEAMGKYKKDVNIEVVEIDPEVINVGYEFFNLRLFPNIKAINDDARRFFIKTQKKYDLVLGDAFNGIRYVPAHLLTSEFFDLVKNRLNDNGVFMINIISSIKGDNSILFQSVMKTLSESFANTYVFSINSHYPYASQNIIIVATEVIIDSFKFKQIMSDLSLKKLLETFIPPENFDIKEGIIFTDNYNPVESIIAKEL